MVYALYSSAFIVGDLVELDQHSSITSQNMIDFVQEVVHLAGVGDPNLQRKAIKAIESDFVSWPNAVADSGGIIDLSKVILQVDLSNFCPWK